MKGRFLSVGLALLAAALLPSAAVATHSNGTGPKHDFVSGTGKAELSGFSYKVHVNAKSGPDGEDPRGRATFDSPDFPASPFNFRGDVTCMDVDGRNAVVAGVVEEYGPDVTPPGPVSNFYIWIEDNGEGNDSADGFNALIISAGALPPPTVCSSSFGGLPFNQGNFVVHDAGT